MSMSKFTVFVGGTEVNDFLLTREQAEQLAERYSNYDDVKIIEYKEGEMKDPGLSPQREKVTHIMCKGYYDQYTGDFDCDYNTTLTCEECKYGLGNRNPAAICNQV